jgi:outer membrane protein W
MKHFQEFFLVVVVVLGISSAQLYAQSSPRLWLGVRAGADIGNMSFDPTPPSGETIGSTTGITGGGELDYWFSDNIGISAQLLFTQKGVKIDFSEGGYTFTTAITLSYLQIPVLLKATFGSGNIKPFVFAGPEVGIKLSAKEKVTVSGKDTTEAVPDSVYSSINLGIMVGAGVSFSINPTTMIFLDAAYDHGLSNLNGTTSKDTEKGFTRDYRICLGILFGLGD